jgi:hypothetical protein
VKVEVLFASALFLGASQAIAADKKGTDPVVGHGDIPSWARGGDFIVFPTPPPPGPVIRNDPGILWANDTQHINIEASWYSDDNPKSYNQPFTAPKGTQFCGWKYLEFSASRSNWAVSTAYPNGFLVSASARAGTLTNQVGAWLHADVYYRWFRVVTPGTPIPDCDSDGYTMASSTGGKYLGPISASCQGGVLICKSGNSYNVCGGCVSATLPLP